MKRDPAMGRSCGRILRRAFRQSGWAALVLGTAAVAVGAPAEKGAPMPVTSFEVSYENAKTQPVSLEGLGDVVVPLRPTATGYAGPVAGEPTVNVKLSEVPQLKQHLFYPSAIYQVDAQILDYLTSHGLGAVVVMPSPADVDPNTGADKRSEKGKLHLVIRVGVASGLRTVAAGDRVPEAKRVNNPLHERIIRKSPIQPGGPFDKKALDDYVWQLNRMPGRRVDVAVTRGDRPGALSLDYLVNEAKPWQAYYQISNTGTKNTDGWRNRFGLSVNQLTNHDDVLTVEYATSLDFNSSRAFIGSYESRFGDSDKLRWRVDGNWDDFTAAEVGNAFADFTGSDYSVGGSLIYNVAQWGPTFLDALVGVRWQNVSINNTLAGSSGSQNFFLPYGGFQIDHATDIDNLNAQLTVAANVPGIAGDTTSGLTMLDRVAPDKDFVLVNYSAQYSTFLEPLLNHEAWTHDADHAGTLANELVFLVHGQYSNGRLVPHMQDVAGGFYTVRGYDESLVAGDSSVIGTVEYRLHIPRTFDPVDPSKTPLFGRPFRFAPQNVYGTADWDLIFRAFTDVGYVTDNDPIAGIEGSSTLVGSGVGLEFIYKQNLSVRVDWAAALTDVSSGGVTLAPAGSNRFHIAVTLYY